ncbi:YkgG family protein [Formosa agariphila KMM 3901]|uniref:YkgG family protein n=1 Tax=Formosa agariphila (strain DSM 15362 / KCTC 12365 / LMG 23005 / KMM 3901 / M-2Alg 35-1) TaxID=1347342 RepID=T2KQK1_FORAG|nr:LUD domain-containing protein [Formosa agariphila]CDF80778.1 YkgG family protein [Formosa agariphila KMM 3901]
MGSREQILAKIKSNKPELIDLPIIDSSVFKEEDLDVIAEFIKKVEVVGGNVLKTDSNQDVITQIEATFANQNVRYSHLDETSTFNTISLESIQNPHELETLDTLVLESTLGVAENGAVWLSDNEIPVRVLPFITKHLAIVISQKNIVAYMHEAYKKLSDSELDYGVFVAGPSKTADIEQSLVIGAHGALSLTIFLKD